MRVGPSASFIEMDDNAIALEENPASNPSFKPQSPTMNVVEDINHTRKGSTPAPDTHPPLTEDDRKKRVLRRAMSVNNPPRKKCDRNILTTISTTIIESLEKAFFVVGRFVGTYPVLTVVLSLLMCILCALMVDSFTPGSDNEEWVPTTSRLLDEKHWVEDTYGNEIRFVSYLFEDTNVLTPIVFQSMYKYYKRSLTINRNNGKKLEDLCVKIVDDCSVVSLLELWEYNETEINSLTEADILDKINTEGKTPRSNRGVVTLLGGRIDKNGSRITGAQATQMSWELTKVDESATKVFEELMIDYGLEPNNDVQAIYVTASRSAGDEANAALDDDVIRLGFGFVIVFLYILLALGRFNLMEQKIYLAMCGMLTVILSILVAYGLGAGLGIQNSALQTLLPFLLLGIGVDDMFVISEAWRNLSPEDDELPVPDKISVCLAHAGMSITVTSVTDVVAFGIGASTVIPALGSFCLFAALGIIGLFCLVTTFFVAALTFDERRRRQRRDACICCYKHPESYEPNKCSTGRSFLQRVFAEFYGPFILKKPVKIIIIILSLAMVSIGMWRFSVIEEDFDPINYIPSNSYAYKYARASERLFQTQGIATRIYCADFDYYAEMGRLESMQSRMETSKYIQNGTINSWFNFFHNYIDNNAGVTVSSEAEYYTALKDYLNGEGINYKSFVLFNTTKENEPFKIKASFITATHTRGEKASDNIEVMDGLRDIIDSTGFPKFSGGGLPEYKCFAFVSDYQGLETNKVLGEELMRNLTLAAVTVLVMTIILVADIKASLLVFACVFFTVIDVGGSLELWSVTIDTASSVLLTLAVGLAVDYSAHIGHTFMTVEGTREERALLTLKDIGPAVFNGGLSTLLAFILLADSASYGFELFFKVFLLVVLLGMFHGLTLLPVLLSLLGPPSYKEARQKALMDAFSSNDRSDDYHHNRKSPMQGNGNNGEIPFSGSEGSYVGLSDDKGSRPGSA